MQIKLKKFIQNRYFIDYASELSFSWQVQKQLVIIRAGRWKPVNGPQVEYPCFKGLICYAGVRNRKFEDVEHSLII
jgi:hypothetical protein